MWVCLVADKAPSEAVFRGTEFLSYDLSHTGGEPIVSAQDAVTFYFKTRQPNGLLFYTGERLYCAICTRYFGLYASNLATLQSLHQHHLYSTITSTLCAVCTTNYYVCVMCEPDMMQTQTESLIQVSSRANPNFITLV